MKRHCNGISLIELLVAVMLVGIIVVAFASIQRFSIHHVIATDKRAKLQNDGFFIIEHITKKLVAGVGDVALAGNAPFKSYANGVAIRIENATATPGNYLDDEIVGYIFDSDAHTVSYCSPIGAGGAYPSQLSAVGSCEVLSKQVYNFSVKPEADTSSLTGATPPQAFINMTMRYNAGATVVDENNPEINLTSRVVAQSASGR